jgi:serine/threonine protein kinase
MLFGQTPFMEEGKIETMDRIKNVDFRFPPNSRHRNVSTAAKDLIRRLLVEDPAKRLPLTRVMSHPWIVKNIQS